jgi:hypothetical protein
MEAPSVAVEVDNTSAATELNSGYIKGTICHGRGRGFESRRPRHFKSST